MPKARFKFNEDGSIEINKGQHVVVLGKTEVDTFARGKQEKPTASQMGLAKDFKRFADIMHEYMCSECDDMKFHTMFAPIFGKPAFCPCCGSDENVNYIIAIDLELARSAPETTASPSGTAADKGILTEEELKKRLKWNQEDHGLTTVIANEILQSHLSLLSANAELSFKNMKIPVLEADNKLLEEVGAELEQKVSDQNDEICRMQDEISILRGENNHE
jgi:hypothetical protein